MKTLSELIETIMAYEGTWDVLQAQAWLAGYAGADWKDYLRRRAPGADSVTILRNDTAKLLLIRWDAYARSNKHGHPERGCLLKVLAGVLVENRYDPREPGRRTGRYHLFKGGMAFIHDDLAFHQVENPTPFPAISLHLYAPGIYTPRIIPAAPAGENFRSGG